MESRAPKCSGPNLFQSPPTRFCLRRLKIDSLQNFHRHRLQRAPFKVVLFRSSYTKRTVCMYSTLFVLDRIFSLLNIIEFLANRNLTVVGAPLRKRCYSIERATEILHVPRTETTSACPTAGHTERSDGTRILTSHVKALRAYRY